MLQDDDLGEVVWNDIEKVKPAGCNLQQRRQIQELMWRKNLSYVQVVRLGREVSGKKEMHGVGELSKEEAEKVIKKLEER